jgi:hypothetical protein
LTTPSTRGNLQSYRGKLVDEDKQQYTFTLFKIPKCTPVTVCASHTLPPYVHRLKYNSFYLRPHPPIYYSTICELNRSTRLESRPKIVARRKNVSGPDHIKCHLCSR